MALGQILAPLRLVFRSRTADPGPPGLYEAVFCGSKAVFKVSKSHREKLPISQLSKQSGLPTSALKSFKFKFQLQRTRLWASQILERESQEHDFFGVGWGGRGTPRNAQGSLWGGIWGAGVGCKCCKAARQAPCLLLLCYCTDPRGTTTLTHDFALPAAALTSDKCPNGAFIRPEATPRGRILSKSRPPAAGGQRPAWDTPVRQWLRP